jgi:hypothetical protein
MGDPLIALGALEDRSDAHTAPDAEGGNAVAGTTLPQLVYELDCEHGAAGTDWMPEGNRPSQGVQLLFRYVELSLDRERNGREGFVDLEDIDVLERQRCFLQSSADCWYGPQSHVGRIDADHCIGEEARIDGKSQRLRFRSARHQHKARAVGQKAFAEPSRAIHLG